MVASLERYARSPGANAGVAAAFIVTIAAGWAVDGTGFVQEWGGSFAAVIATAFLVWKTQGYWVWMIVNAALWVAPYAQKSRKLTWSHASIGRPWWKKSATQRAALTIIHTQYPWVFQTRKAVAITAANEPPHSCTNPVPSTAQPAAIVTTNAAATPTLTPRLRA